MASNVLEGTWNEIRGEVKDRWGEITDQDLDQIAGNRDKLVGTLQQKYGFTKQRAEQEVAAYTRDFDRKLHRTQQWLNQNVDLEEMTSNMPWKAILGGLAAILLLGFVFKTFR